MQGIARSGLSREQAYELLDSQRIKEQVLKTDGEMEALPPGQSKPTPEQIETALEAFSVKQWTPVERWPPIELSPPMERWPIIEYRYGLMESVGLVDVEALLSYIREHAGELKQRLGARKVEAIERRAIERSRKLWLAENRTTLEPRSDPYWALFFRDQAHEANCAGKGHPATGRSVAELSSDRALARRLTKRDEQTGREMNVSPYQVKQWLARMEELPFEQYATEIGADDEEKRGAAFIDYLTIHKKHQRKR